jgi:hypothetical protein
MPDALRRDLRDEGEPPVGVLGGRIRLLDGHDQPAGERAVCVRRSELAPRAEPPGVHLPTADEAVAPDVEDVGEVRDDGDLDREADRPTRVVDDVEVLVHALVDGPVEADGERLAIDQPGFVEELLVRELEAGAEELDRGGVQEERPLAVDQEVVAGDQPRVAGEEAVVGTAQDPGVRLAHEEPIIPIDRDRRGADLDRERHPGIIGKVEGGDRSLEP